MSREKPGIFRRLFGFIGKLASGLRILLNILFLLVVVVFILSIFRKDVQPLPGRCRNAGARSHRGH